MRGIPEDELRSCKLRLDVTVVVDEFPGQIYNIRADVCCRRSDLDDLWSVRILPRHEAFRDS